MYTEIPQLLKYFQAGKTPTEDQFIELITSFWHKSEKLSLDDIQNLINELDKLLLSGDYTGTAQDLKAAIDAIQFEGVLTYQNKSDLPDASILTDGLSAKVANDSDATKNGYYSVSGGAWVKDADLYENEVSVNNTSKAISGKAVASYRERFNCFEEYKATENIGYSDKIKSASNSFLEVTIKDFYNAFSYFKLFGFAKNLPHKLSQIGRNDTNYNYSFKIHAWDGETWLEVYNSSNNFEVTESNNGITHVSSEYQGKRVVFGIDYSVLPDNTYFRPNHYRNGGGFETGQNNPELVIKPDNIYEDLNGIDSELIKIVKNEALQPAENLANLELDDFKTVVIPKDNTDTVFSTSNYLTTNYYTDRASLLNGEVLKNIFFKSLIDTSITIAFLDLSSGTASVLHEENVTAEIGVNVIKLEDLSVPGSVFENSEIFIAISPTETSTFKASTDVGELKIISKTTGAISSTALSNPLWIEKISIDLLPLEQLILEGLKYDYTDNLPILPPQLFLIDDEPLTLYRQSLFQKFKNKNLPNVLLLSEKHTFEISEPSQLIGSDLGTTGRLLINDNTLVNNILYKDIEIIKGTLAGKSGSTITLMTLGDSLTEGGNGNFNTSPMFLLTQALAADGITLQGVGTLQRTSGNITQKIEGRGGWRFRTFVGLEPKFSSLAVTLPSETQSTWIEGVDGVMNTIKANNVFLYPATAQELLDYPEWCFHFVSGSSSENVSFSTNPSLGTYHIFNPAKYLSERNITAPDVLSIALGTNEWYLGGFSGWDLPLIVNCANWMITRLVAAMPTTKIIVMACNNFPLSLDNHWKNKASYLTAEIQKICETKRANGAANLFCLSTYAEGSRKTAYNQQLAGVNISSGNTVKIAEIDSNVHMLNANDSGRKDYLESLRRAIVCSL